MTTQIRSGRAYVVRFLTASGVHTILLLVSVPLVQSRPAGSPVRYLLACLPAVGVALGIWVLWRFVREADKLQSRKLMESLALSTAGTLFVAFCVGMVQLVSAPALSWVWIIPLWAVFLGIGAAWTSRKHR